MIVEIECCLQNIEAPILSVKQGVGHSSEQVFAWLDSWSEGKKLPIPKPDILEPSHCFKIQIL